MVSQHRTEGLGGAQCDRAQAVPWDCWGPTLSGYFGWQSKKGAESESLPGVQAKPAPDIATWIKLWELRRESQSLSNMVRWISQLSHHWDTILNTHNLKEDRLIFGSQLQSIQSLVDYSKSETEEHGKGELLTTWQPESREWDREGAWTGLGHTPSVLAHPVIPNLWVTVSYKLINRLFHRWVSAPTIYSPYKKPHLWTWDLGGTC